MRKVVTNPNILRRNQYYDGLAENVEKEVAAEVAAAIAVAGHWERTEEWRMCCLLTSRIEPVDEDGKPWYRLTVTNGIEVTCLCPTISRAIHYMALLEGVSKDLFLAQGWSSWAEKGRLRPEPDEI